MRTLRRWWLRLSGGIRRRDAELEEEFAAHLDFLTEENVRHGMTPEDARRAARLTFGSLDAVKEGWRDQRTFPWLEETRRDVRYALRGLRRSPGFTFVAASCLALGIGAASAVFSVVNAVVLRPLAVREPGQLVVFSCDRSKQGRAMRVTSSGFGGQSLPYAAFSALQSAQTLSGVVAFAGLGFGGRGAILRFDGRAVAAGGELASAGYFTVLGVQPVLGRTFASGDVHASAPDTIVLSHSLWQREFAGSPAVLGRTITVNTLRATVIGVAPADFRGLNPAEPPAFWMPMKSYPGLQPWGSNFDPASDRFHSVNWWWCMMAGRLRPGVKLAAARAETEVLFQQAAIAPLMPDAAADKTPRLALTPAGRGLDHLRSRFERSFRVLMGAVGLIMLITITNIATLLLARAGARRREMDIRLSIGASRARLVRQLMTESVVLSVGGGIGGWLFAWWGGRALLALLAPASGAAEVDVHPDLPVLAFTAGLALMAGLLFGLVPALRGTRVRAESASVAARQQLARGLVAVQVALSVVLLFGAGLFLRTLRQLRAEDLGLRAENLLLFELDARTNGYDATRTNAAYGEVLRQLAGVPGVQSVSASSLGLLSGWSNNTNVTTEAARSEQRGWPSLYYNQVGPDFLRTYGIGLLMGRDIGWHDFGSPARVAVVNEAFARAYFNGQSPLGRRFCLGRAYDPAESYEIVGLARDAKFDRVRVDAPPTAYTSFTAGTPKARPMTVAIRTAGEPSALVAAVREAVRSADPQLPMMKIRTQTAQINDAMLQERMFARLSTLLGALALLLVSIGLYGTLAFAVVKRTREIGLRVALGATHAGVLWMVLRESLVVAAAGLAVGLPAALAVGRLLSTYLYGVKPHDAAALAASVIVLTAVCAAAGYLPARRAARIDPMRALHCE